MKQKESKININTIIVAVIALVTVIAVASISYVTISYINNNKESNNEIEEEKEDTNNNIEDTGDIADDEDKEDTNLNNSQNNAENNNSSSNNNNSTGNNTEKTDTGNTNSNNNPNSTSEKTKLTEEEFVAYMQSQNDSITSKTLGDKAKEIFITTVDFIFYGGKIKGYTFSELTDKAKLQVLKIGLSIDNKIEQYFPGYKESLSSTYSKVKAKLVELYLDLTVKLCDTIGSSACNQAKIDFQNMKDSFSITWEFIKDIGISAISKLASWYEIYSGK